MHVCVPDSAAPWDARPSASPSLSEVAPPVDSLAMSSPSSHLAPDPPHLPPLDVPRDPAVRESRTTERSKSPQKAELLNPDPIGQGRRAATPSGSGRAKKEGGRSTHKAGGHRVQPTTEGEGGTEGQSGEPRSSRSTRGRSKERNAADGSFPSGKTESAPSPGSAKLPNSNSNGNGREDGERYGGGQRVEPEQSKPRPREPDRGPGESRTSHAHKNISSGRKVTVSPGPWKIPGSDKLPSSLRAGTSTLSR